MYYELQAIETCKDIILINVPIGILNFNII